MKRLNWKRRLPICVSVVLMLTLTGCLKGNHSGPAYGHPTQPPYLYLESGQPYIPVQNEKWVNPRVLQEKDQRIMDLNETLNKYGIHSYLPTPAN